MHDNGGEHLVILGGNTAGLSTALTVRRCGDSRPITILEKNSYIGVGNCGLPYKLGESSASLRELIRQDPGKFAEKYNVDLKTEAVVEEVDSSSGRVHFREGEVEKYIEYENLVIASGSRPFVPSQFEASEQLFTATTVEELEEINRDLPRASGAAVLGAGPIGVEFSYHLARLGLDVTLVEKFELLQPFSRELAAEVRSELQKVNVHIMEDTAVEDVRGRRDNFVIETESGSFQVELAIGAFGFTANTGFIDNPELEKKNSGAIPVDKYMRAGLPGVYAAGDVVARPLSRGGSQRWPMASSAALDGWTVGMNITGNRQTRASELKRMGFALGDKSFARIGNLEAADKVNWVESETSFTFEEKKRVIRGRVAYNSENRVLGAETIADGNLAGQLIEPLASLILNRGKITDLSQLEPVYHPGMNPVNSLLAVAARRVLQEN